jgi:glycosyltransferase involved in cell wall biosynthesis
VRLDYDLVILVTNDVIQDQRMQRIAIALTELGIKSCIVGRRINISPRFKQSPYDIKLLKLPFKRGPLFYLFYNLQATYFLLRIKSKVIYSVDFDTLPAAVIVKFLTGRKLVFDAHELFSEVPELEGSPLKKKVWQKVGGFGIQQADLCLTVGKAIAKELKSRYKREFHPILNLPANPLIDESEASNFSNKLILYQGMLNAGRGLETMIKAMEFLSDWQLLLVGKGDLMEKLQDMVEKSSLSDRIVFTGFVPPDELPVYTSKATIGINLLESNSLSYYYSLANKTFDYMTQGVPGIHMNFPEYKAIQDKYNCFILIDALKPKLIADEILQLNESNYQQLVRANLGAAKFYLWEEEKKKIQALFNQLLIETPPPAE